MATWGDRNVNNIGVTFSSSATTLKRYRFSSYESMGADVTQRQQTYRQYLLDARGRALEEALFRSPAKALGSGEFLANLYRSGGRATARRVGRPRAPGSV